MAAHTPAGLPAAGSARGRPGLTARTPGPNRAGPRWGGSAGVVPPGYPVGPMAGWRSAGPEPWPGWTDAGRARTVPAAVLTALAAPRMRGWPPGKKPWITRDGPPGRCCWTGATGGIIVATSQACHSSDATSLRLERPAAPAVRNFIRFIGNRSWLFFAHQSTLPRLYARAREPSNIKSQNSAKIKT